MAEGERQRERDESDREFSYGTFMKESCRTYEWVRSHTWKHEKDKEVSQIEAALSFEWEMWHIWMCHVTHLNVSSCRTCEWVVSRMSRYTYEWVMSHIWTSHGTHMDESCCTYKCVTSHAWMGHVNRMAHTNESRHTYERVMSHIWTSHITQLNESCCRQKGRDLTTTSAWVMSHIWMRYVVSQGAPMSGSCLIHKLPLSLSHTHTRKTMTSPWFFPLNKSWHTSEWVMSYIWMSHVTLHSLVTSEWVMSLLWRGHVTILKESCHTGKKTKKL